MKKSVLTVALFSSILAVACSQQQPAPKADDKAPTTATAPATNNAPAYVGVYTGVLPCADCDGIETTVEIKADGQYVLTEQYKKDGAKTDKTEGKTSFDEKTSILTLEATDPLLVRKFLIEGDKITQVSNEGKKSESKELNYTLTKSSAPAEAPKGDAPKAEEPKADTPKTEEAPKADAPKTEEAKK